MLHTLYSTLSNTALQFAQHPAHSKQDGGQLFDEVPTSSFQAQSQSISPGSLTALNGMTAMLLLVFAILWLFLGAWAGRWIWNNILTKYVTIVKPIESLYDFILLVLLVQFFTSCPSAR